MRTRRFLLIGLAAFLTQSVTHAGSVRLINIRDMYPSITPDSRTLVFQSNRSGVDQIFSMDLSHADDIKPSVQLTHSKLVAETPSVSPDGKKIVLSMYVAEDNNDVFTMNVDGTGLTQLTSAPGYDGHPHWNVDGTRIVFNSDRTTPDAKAPWNRRWHEIFSMRSDGSDVQQHTRCEVVCTYGSVSPDGSRVLYRKVINSAGFNWDLSHSERNSEVFVADLDGANEINLTENAAFDGWPVWSPDGRQIAFASNRTGPAMTGQIWLVNRDGSDLRQITDGPLSHTQPSWSADGKSLYAFQSKETVESEFGTVVRIDLD